MFKREPMATVSLLTNASCKNCVPDGAGSSMHICQCLLS